MDSRKSYRIGLCALGYVLAVLAGFAAVWFLNLGVPQGDGSDGMRAFGDLVCFMGAVSLFSTPSTLGLLAMVDWSSRFWGIYAGASLLVGLTALPTGISVFLPLGGKGSLLAALQMVAVLRALAAPPCFLLHLPGLLLGPDRTRKAFLLACALESVVLGAFLVRLAFSR